MSSRDSSKSSECWFAKYGKKIKHLNSIATDYKILLFLCMIWGLPFYPFQLLNSPGKKGSRLITLFSTLVMVARTILCLFSMNYTQRLFSVTSVMVTLNSFNLCSLIGSWCLFKKRRDIVQAMKMVLSVLGHVASKTFKSGWNVLLFLGLHVIGVSIITANTLILSLDAMNGFNGTNLSFMAINFNRYNDVFYKLVIISNAVTYSFSSSMCGIILILSATCYYHLGDVVLNFGMKLKRRFECEAFHEYSISENMEMFQRIIELNKVVDGALSGSVLFLYGAVISCFFNGVGMLMYLQTITIIQTIATLSMFTFSLSCFFIVTLTGNRVRKMHRELQEFAMDCSRLILTGDLSQTRLMCFALMKQDINTMDIQVTGGNLFIIRNSLILSIAGLLVTYGVIIFQMD